LFICVFTASASDFYDNVMTTMMIRICSQHYSHTPDQ